MLKQVQHVVNEKRLVVNDKPLYFNFLNTIIGLLHEFSFREYHHQFVFKTVFIFFIIRSNVGIFFRNQNNFIIIYISA